MTNEEIINQICNILHYNDELETTMYFEELIKNRGINDKSKYRFEITKNYAEGYIDIFVDELLDNVNYSYKNLMRSAFRYLESGNKVEHFYTKYESRSSILKYEVSISDTITPECYFEMDRCVNTFGFIYLSLDMYVKNIKRKYKINAL